MYVCMYVTPEKEHLKIVHLKAITDKTKSIEEDFSEHEPKNKSKYIKKWRPFIEKFV